MNDYLPFKQGVNLRRQLKHLAQLWIIHIGKVCKATLSATATRNSHYCTCLGHLWGRNTDGIISVYVTMPKVAKASK
jgi:hypothetical protein